MDPGLTKWEVSDVSEVKSVLELPGPVPTPGREMPTEVADERKSIEKLTKETPRDTKGEEAFIASKAKLVLTHPKLDREGRERAYRELTERVGKERLEVARAKEKDQPVPGGVGYGPFYNSTYKSAFAQGTSLYFEIICPTSPGGNVNTWFYLTGMNRAGRGIEAFVSYYAQTQPHFKVFD
jgi:hypothetical protein